MKLTSMKIESLEDLFVQELKDIYDAEKQIVEALPKMIDAATSPELKHGFEKHLEETKQQFQRLEDVFDVLDMEPETEHCDGMAGLIKDGEKIISAEGDPDVKDAALIAAAQKVEHYEIASYGTLRTYARILGHDEAADMLQQTLNQEHDTDKQLTEMAERSINVKASGA